VMTSRALPAGSGRMILTGLLGKFVSADAALTETMASTAAGAKALSKSRDMM
jgi:hypothetical protein